MGEIRGEGGTMGRTGASTEKRKLSQKKGRREEDGSD